MSQKVTYSQLISVLGIKEASDSMLESLFLSMLELEEKINNIEEQSWGFKKGIENSKEHLKEYKNKINKIRVDFNNSTVDSLISRLKEAQSSLEATKNWTGTYLHRSMVESSANSSITYINMLLAIKSRINHFEDIEFYTTNKDELIKLLGW